MIRFCVSESERQSGRNREIDAEKSERVRDEGADAAVAGKKNAKAATGDHK